MRCSGGEKEKEATRYIWKYSCSTAVFSCQVVKTLIGFKVDMVTKFSSYERAAAQWSVHASTCWMLLPPLIQLHLSSTKSQQRSSQNALNCITEIKPNNQRAPFEQALGSGKGKKSWENQAQGGAAICCNWFTFISGLHQPLKPFNSSTLQ